MEVTYKTLPDHLDLPPQIVTRSPPQYFTLPTTMAAVGPRGRGKTYNLCLWNKWMFDNEYFTRFYCISPTYISNDPVKQIPTRQTDIFTNVANQVQDLLEIIQRVESDARWYQAITETYTDYYNEYMSVNRDLSRLEREKVTYLRGMQKEIDMFYEDVEMTLETMEVPNKSMQYILRNKPNSPNKTLESIVGTRYDDMHPWFWPPPKMRKPVPLLFIDDCSHSPIYAPSRSNPLVNLTLRHRHIGGQGFGVSIQFAVQTFKTGVPKALRQNTMQFLIFKTNDMGTILDIYEELGAFVDKESFVHLYKKAMQGDHDFLLIDTNAKKPERVFRRNWDTFLILPARTDNESMIDENDKNLS